MQKKAILFSAETYDLSKYAKVPNLPGCSYDIFAMQKRLKQMDFDVHSYRNAKKKDFSIEIENIIHSIPNDAITIVYFTGHGGHYKGHNYILPVDFGSKLDSSKEIKDAAVDIDEIIALFRGRGRLILILDSCRSELIPFAGNYSEMSAAENVYIAYATSFGSTSKGVYDSTSWFTEALCDEILTPDIDIDMIFTRVRQNVVTKHHAQIPASVNLLLDKVVLHTTKDYDALDKNIYDFVEKNAALYEDKYGYFKGEHMVFIDAAQYFNISFLDVLWCYQKVSDKLATNMGIKVPITTEEESKLISFIGLPKNPKNFYHDEYHTWYYNGRLIRLGEIPPLPPSMQQKTPENGRAINLLFAPRKEDDVIFIATNLPNNCEIFINDNTQKYSRKYKVQNGNIIIYKASNIHNISIQESAIFTNDEEAKLLLGEKNRNLIGEFIKHHPIHGNLINYTFNF